MANQELYSSSEELSISSFQQLYRALMSTVPALREMPSPTYPLSDTAQMYCTKKDQHIPVWLTKGESYAPTSKAPSATLCRYAKP